MWYKWGEDIVQNLKECYWVYMGYSIYKKKIHPWKAFKKQKPICLLVIFSNDFGYFCYPYLILKSLKTKQIKVWWWKGSKS